MRIKKIKKVEVKDDLFYDLNIFPNNNYILGIGFGRKVTGAEQECAKMCLENLHLDLNF